MSESNPSSIPEDAGVAPAAGFGDVAMSALDADHCGPDDRDAVPMSFDSAATLLRQRVLDPPSHPGILANLDAFRVIRVLGVGGMGVVVQARHPVTDALVAIKLVKPELVNDKRVIHRFLIEARHMHHLSHPNIVRVMEVSDRARGPYYVMPFYPGSLAQAIEPGVPLKPEMCLSIAGQIAEAIAHAHGRGVIHRDLKPGNVLLDREGHAYVSDFGLVRTVFNDSIVDVQKSHCEGTAAYMSPAVAAGQAEDTRCDIYALGAILYEMLTGRPPYSGPPLQVIRQVLAGPPPPIRDLNPRADARLTRIAETAMARELRDRYAMAADLAADLKLAGQGREPAGARGDRGRRNRSHFFVMTAAAFVLLGCSLVLSMRWIGSKGHQTAAVPPIAISPAPAAEPPDPRPPPAIFTGLNPGEIGRYTSHTAETTGIAFAPDDREFVSCGADGTAQRIDVATGRVIWTFRGDGPDPAFASVVFTPDGKKLVIGAFDATIRVLDAATGLERNRLIGHSACVIGLDVSPDGTKIVSTSGHWEPSHPHDYSVRLWDLATGRQLRELTDDADVPILPMTSGAFSPDGKMVAAGCNDHMVRLWGSGGNFIARLAGHHDRNNACFSPDSKYLLSAEFETLHQVGIVRLWDLSRLKTVQLIETARGATARFAPDGKHFSVVSANGFSSVFQTRSGQLVCHLAGHQHWVTASVWSHDGKRLLTSSRDHTVRLWHVSGLDVPDPGWPAVREVGLLFSTSTPVNAVAFSPDGARAASGSADGTVRLWQLDGERELQALKTSAGPVMSVCFSQDGAHILFNGIGGVRSWDGMGPEASRLSINEIAQSGVAVGPDGRFAAVAGLTASANGQRGLSRVDDYVVRVMDLGSGREIARFQPPAGTVRNAAISPDGTAALTAGDDGGIRIWSMTKMP